MEDLLTDLVERLQRAYGGELLSVVLYGSAATSDYHEQHSDLNVLCVLERVGLPELERSGEALRWWTKQGQPTPLLLSAEEVRDSTDVFPIEFLDIKESYRVLYGADLVKDIQVDMSKHRTQLEHELRSRLLRLRKHFLKTQHDDKAVSLLMLESLPTFATLFRHVLLAAGFPAPVKKHDIFQAAAQHLHVGPSPFDALLEVRKGSRKLVAGELRSWFESYLAAITAVSEIVDKL
ncbi:MAG TPA: nucleotidyltransferase domain-containing protein [Bryobacterales bacterium]|jgi:predicted nucleotidyltransferase|nr:nucleotidyltransferase domain-containing protein [Bryobacterales bacterium]